VKQLLVGRAVQGIGAALMVPGSLAILSASFSERDRGRAIGTWSGFTSITSAVGPVLGGWLIEHASWHWVFFVNLPLALIVVVLTLGHVPESRSMQEGQALDWAGAVLATVGLGGVVFALIESSHRGWDTRVVGAALVGVFALIAFVAVERRKTAPLLPIGLFRERNFAGANLLTLFLYTALSATLFFFPLNLIQVQGYTATAAASALFPFIVLMFVLSRWSGKLVSRYGRRRPLLLGPIVASLGFALFAAPSTGGTYWVTFFPAVMVLGLGMAISVAPLTTTVMNSVGQEHAGIASGINNAVARLAAVLAIALFGIVMLGSFNRHLSQELAVMNVSAETRRQIDDQRIKLAGMKVPPEVRRSVDESFIAGFRLVMLMSAGLGLASAASTWLFIGDER